MGDPLPAALADPAAEALRQVLELIERRRLSRAELARRLGVSPAYVTKILGRRINFTLDTLARLAAVLDATVEVRLIGSPPHPPTPSPPSRWGRGAATRIRSQALSPAGDAPAGATRPAAERRPRAAGHTPPAASPAPRGRPEEPWRCW